MEKLIPQAVSDRIFIQLDESVSSSKLILTDCLRPRNKGTVISVGPLVHSVGIGDKVLFHTFDDLPTYDENVVVIRENSLLGRFLSDSQSDVSISEQNQKQ